MAYTCLEGTWVGCRPVYALLAAGTRTFVAVCIPCSSTHARPTSLHGCYLAPPPPFTHHHAARLRAVPAHCGSGSTHNPTCCLLPTPRAHTTPSPPTCHFPGV